MLGQKSISIWRRLYRGRYLVHRTGDDLAIAHASPMQERVEDTPVCDDSDPRFRARAAGQTITKALQALYEGAWRLDRESQTLQLAGAALQLPPCLASGSDVRRIAFPPPLIVQSSGVRQCSSKARMVSRERRWRPANV